MKRRLSLALVALLTALALVAFHCLAWGSWAEFFAGIDFNDQPFEDFLGFYLPMGQRVGALDGPVPGFYYSPAFALALSLFAGLEQLRAVWVWLGVEVLATLGLLALPLWLAPESVASRTGGLGGAGLDGTGLGGDELGGDGLGGEREQRARAFYLVAAGFSFPWLHNLHWGQVSVLVGLSVLAGFLFYQRGRQLLAGFCFALAIAIKFYPALFLLPFLIRGERRLLASTAGFSLLLLVLLPLSALGAEGTTHFYEGIVRGLQAASESPGLWAEAANKQYMPAVVLRLLGVEGPAPELARALVWLGAALFLGVLAWIWRRRPGPVRAEEFAALALALPLVSSPSWPHYFVLLPFACLVALRACRPWARALVLPAALLSSVLVFRACADSQAYGHSGLLLWADLLLLVALLSSPCARPRSS